MHILRISLAAGLALTVLSACGEVARLPVEAGMGPNPQLPPPNTTLIPTVNTARAVGWPPGAHPVAASGLAVTAYAGGLDHPRWLYVLPNGDVLVAETNAPPKPEDAAGGIKAWATGVAMKRAGAKTVSANRITLLRDADHDGVAETRSVLLEGLNSPFGMALIGNQLYVANADAVMRYPYETGQTHIAAPGVKVTDLPAGINHHWTKNLLASADGARLYVSVGSNSNVGENGMDIEEGRAAIWELDVASGAKRLYATGLRNPVGMAWAPDGKTLWTAVNERDELGSDLVPDYMTSVRDGGFYGWPYSYFGQHVDTRVEPQRPELVAQAIVPDYALGPHTASLGLAWSGGAKLPEPYINGMFVGQHGSWNRDPRSGYKVIFVPFDKNQPSGPARDVLTGFLNESGQAQGRPVGVAIDAQGGLLVADDVGNVVWRVGAQP
ncbi:PQQ-dependent sugar dehydrogenase [Achromobacter deleyi]|uniref:PQQ-dependent sugar dehydrogenase n=1 Tax=Achromobacter deleyi TaxID=1353891 RepID=UPI00149243B2|nr:sorbosone dehydrogenase family protein [Achromobacter deleyi]QVQ26592.1 sorbosone dehydrogenase family protein [Achromobacter deleyi]UIP22166.1 sorbosone dehydrogenase family protein [Achromobacter deleyi]